MPDAVVEQPVAQRYDGAVDERKGK
jgi:hypothetical protein